MRRMGDTYPRWGAIVSSREESQPRILHLQAALVSAPRQSCLDIPRKLLAPTVSQKQQSSAGLLFCRLLKSKTMQTYLQLSEPESRGPKKARVLELQASDRHNFRVLASDPTPERCSPVSKQIMA